MKYLKLFEDRFIGKEIDEDFFISCFYDLKDNHGLECAETDIRRRGHHFITPENYPGDCYTFSYAEPRDHNGSSYMDRQGHFYYTVLIKSQIEEVHFSPDSGYEKKCEQVAEKSKPGILSDINDLVNRVKDHHKSTGQKCAYSSRFGLMSCRGIQIIEIILRFNVWTEESDHSKTLKFLKSINWEDEDVRIDMVKKLKDLGYNVEDEKK